MSTAGPPRTTERPPGPPDLDGHVPRDHCWGCDKPRVTCVCEVVPRVVTRTGITILQHPRERRHAIGTARIARLGLPRARVEVAWFGRDRRTTRTLTVPDGAAVLYPHPDARDLATLPPAERPRHLLVLDGTWRHAYVLRRDNPWIADLPHVSLTPPRPSRYRIRKEPRRECLSTIEAIVLALQAIEPDTPGLDGLLGAFDAMIREQEAYIRGDAPRRWSGAGR